MSKIECGQLHSELFGRRHSVLLHGLFALAKHFLISDIRARWRLALSARLAECQKLNVVGQTCMALNIRSDAMTPCSKGLSDI